jgi:hypothetical protein
VTLRESYRCRNDCARGAGRQGSGRRTSIDSPLCLLRIAEPTAGKAPVNIPPMTSPATVSNNTVMFRDGTPDRDGRPAWYYLRNQGVFTWTGAGTKEGRGTSSNLPGSSCHRDEIAEAIRIRTDQVPVLFDRAVLAVTAPVLVQVRGIALRATRGRHGPNVVLLTAYCSCDEARPSTTAVRQERCCRMRRQTRLCPSPAPMVSRSGDGP